MVGRLCVDGGWWVDGGGGMVGLESAGAARHLARQVGAWLERRVVKSALPQRLVASITLRRRRLGKELLRYEQLARVGQVELERRFEATLPRDVVELERALGGKLPARAALEDLEGDGVERRVDPRLAA